MKTKSLILTMTLVACSFFTVSAQELLISENFSSQAWADELLRLNPGIDTNGALINPNATNAAAYTTPPPTTAAGAGTNAYINLNAIDRYFGKYLLLGAIECLPVLPCASGDQITHNFNNGGTETAVAFRILNPGGYIEFPQIPSAGTITLHIRDGNSNSDTSVGLEKYDIATSSWVAITALSLAKYNAYPTTRDEIVTYNVNSSEPITLRLINNVAATKRFINLYGVYITSFAPSAVNTVKVTPFKLIGRKLVSEQPTNLSLYNTQGALVFEKSFATEIELPASLGTGLFLAKNGQGTQKIVIK